MSKAPKPYTRLTRSPVSIGAYHSLWQATDHVMLVTSNGYMESYYRYDFSDIEGFTITPSSRRIAWAVAWGLVWLFPFILLILSVVRGETFSGSLVFLTLFTGIWLWNWLLGPSVRVHILTGVGLTHLPAFSRKRKALRILGRLQPYIEEQQHKGAPMTPPAPPTLS